MSVKHLLKEMKLPERVELIDTEEQNDNTGVIAAEPFERGFATTMGNMFRRVLLSSIQGYAVTAFRIAIGDKFLTSEYESIPGLLEDSLDIVEKIKSLVFLIDQEEDNPTHTITVEFKGKGQCLASSFERPNIQILNSDLVLFEATEEVDLVIELELELGRGFVSSEISEKRIEEVGTIPVDSVFSPIINVRYEVESVRFGNRNDYERMLLTVETNGTITPKDAVAQAAKIIKEQMDIFINFDENDVLIPEKDDDHLLELKKVLQLSIDELELSSRSYNCLRAANIMNIGALVQLSEKEMQNLPNFGNKSMEEIISKLTELDLHLGMTFPPELLAE